MYLELATQDITVNSQNKALTKNIFAPLIKHHTEASPQTKLR